MPRVSDGTDVPVSPAPASSSNMGSPNGSLTDLEGVGKVIPQVQWRKNSKPCSQKDLPSSRSTSQHWHSIPMLVQGFTRFENSILSLSQSAASVTNKISNIEKSVDGLAARVAALEDTAASVSSGSGSARSWNVLGHSDGSTATGSLGSRGPGSSDDNRNTRRRLETFSSPEDEHARSAVLLQFPCEHTTLGLRIGSIIFGKSPTYQPVTNLSEYIAKQVPCQTDSYSKQEPHVRTLWPGIRMTVTLTRWIVPFAKAQPISQSASPSHSKTKKSGNVLRPVESFGRKKTQSFIP